MGFYAEPKPHVRNFTPSDVAPLPSTIVAFRVGTTAGDVEVTDEDGETTIIPNVQIGEMIPGKFTHILDANTTAAGITVFY